MVHSDPDAILLLTVDIVCAHLANNNVSMSAIPELLRSVYDVLTGLSDSARGEAQSPPVPAVSARLSIKPDYLICLEDGKKLKMLKRYLRTHYALTPDEYRRKWNLPADYPMAAPNYSESRRALAKSIGLGRRAAKPSPPVAPAPARAKLKLRSSP
jgi:predicted transcriptional regulator